MPIGFENLYKQKNTLTKTTVTNIITLTLLYLHIHQAEKSENHSFGE